MRTWLSILMMLLAVVTAVAQKQVLTSFEYRVTGQELRVSPAAVAVPKGIAGSVNVELFGVDAGSPLRSNTVVEATLRGPAGPAQRVIGALGQPLMIPQLALVGDYQLDGIRLARVEGTNLVTVLEGSPSSVPVRVFDEVLVSRVTSRPLTSAEIEEKGIFIDEANFRAVEFEVGFVLDGKTIPVRFPVVTPQFRENTEIIPAAELEERLALADSINQEIGGKILLPPELETARLNIQVQAINFQPVDAGENDIALRIPPIPALLVIPGNIGFLNQFFSVQLFTENAAPRDSGLSVFNVRAQMILPPGPDKIPAPSYDDPQDDPLRFARVGPTREIRSNLPVTRAGTDGEFGTPDDVGRLLSGESGQAEFLVEGLQEGLHTMDVELTADLEGLAAGVVKISGKAAGSVLVRNPNFSLAFSHPRTVRFGEPYDASVTILNTSATPANRVRVTLPKTSLSGVIFEGDQQPTVEIGDLAPGQSGTARFRLRAQRTGEIKFSNLTTSDDASRGVFNLTMGVDERGVSLSPDTILLPDLATNLPLRIRIAADRALGQAISVATAGRVPPGILPAPKSLVTRRALDLAEAGQRLLYGDGTNRVLMDLLLDWQGGREFQAGWDQILRETEAGREWREALMAELGEGANGGMASLLGELGAEVAGRGEAWLLAGFENAAGEISFKRNGLNVSAGRSEIPGSLVYGGTNTGWLVVRQPDEGEVGWTISQMSAAHLNVARIGTNGTGVRFDWTLAAQQGCFGWNLVPGNSTLNSDLSCDGAFEGAVPGNESALTELSPRLISARQDLSVLVGRPDRACPVPSIRNYANVVAVLFSKPMSAAQVHQAGAYTIDGDNGAAFVQIQPGGRVALLTLRKPVGGLVPRSITVGNAVTDPRGNALAERTQSILAPFREGVNVAGRVVRADGTAAGNIPVTLTYLDEFQTRDDCADWTKRVAQTQTDSTGRFSFDFVLSGINFVVSATDTSGLSPSEIAVLLESTTAGQLNKDQLAEQLLQAGTLSGLFDANNSAAIAKAEGVDRAAFQDSIVPQSRRSATQLPIVLTFRGRGTVTGRVFASDGVTPVAQAAVNLFADPDSRELGRGVFSDADGKFAFFGVPLGVVSLEVATPSGAGRIVSDALTQPGEIRNINVTVSATTIERGTLAGRILETDNSTAHAGGRVFIKVGDAAIRAVTADSAGLWQVDGLQAGIYNVLAFSQDSRRAGTRNNIAVAAAATNFIEVALNGTATVRGRVLTSAGDRGVSNAMVAGGDVLARTDTNGFFTMTGVPTGNRSISAGVERSEEGFEPKSNPAFDFPRFGSASLEVLPGSENFVIINLTPAARVVGRVLNADNTPKAGAMICQPVDAGFYFINADQNGRFVWENLPIGERIQLSVPGDSPPLSNAALPSGEDAQNDPGAALVSALQVLFGVNDPFLNGTGGNFNPGTFDEKAVTLQFDGESREVIFRMRPKGRVSGRVLNGQDVPIGAAVRVTGEGLSPNMAPTIVIRGDANSDAQTGEFSFEGVAVGNIQLQAASPFFPSVITTARNTTSTDPNATNVILKFPPARETQGRLAGKVFEPNGVTPAGEGIKVAISFGDTVIETDTNSVFDTRFGLPAPVTYTVTATNLSNGLVGQGTVLVNATGTNEAKNFLNVRLLGKGGLNVRVVDFNGNGISGARARIRGGEFPRDSAEGFTAAGGTIPFLNLSEGSYAVEADFSGATRIFGRSSVTLVRNSVTEVVVQLEATATLKGRYVLRDGVTPVRDAQIAIGSLGFATSDELGRFEFAGVPLGTHRILSSDPVSGRAARLDVTLGLAGEVRDVMLVETSLGEVTGAVINSFRTGTAPNARVTISGDSFSQRAVTTGPDGRFSFLNVPAGRFTLRAEDPAFNVGGGSGGVLADDVARVNVDVLLDALAQITVQVWRGTTNVPGTNVSVSIAAGNTFTVDTDANGRARFPNTLPLGNHTLTAISTVFADSHNGRVLVGGATLTSPGTNTDAQIILPGTGVVKGKVVENNGVTPVENASLFLRMLDAPFQGVQIPAVSAVDGTFEIKNVAVGRYSVVAQSASLSAQANGEILAGDEVDDVTLILFPSGMVTGKLLRADGITAVRNEDVSISFTALGSSLGRASAATDANGNFAFVGVPLGNFKFTATIEKFGGVRNVSGTLATDGQVFGLGNVVLDEELPAVASMTPAPDSFEVPTTTVVDVLFSEPIDPQSINRGGIYLRTTAGAPVAATNVLLLASDNQPRLVRITPLVRLLSKTTYQLVIIENDRPAVLDLPAISGPTDLEGRFLGGPFLAKFTTADNDPPVLVSMSPANNKDEVELSEVIRLSFNEPIRQSGFNFVVTGPEGNVPGLANVGFGGLVLVFTPAANFLANGTYQFSVSGVRDIAGNLAAGEPLGGQFRTLDLIAPSIVEFRIADGLAAVAGRSVQLEALLANTEPGAFVRFEDDSGVLGTSSGPDFRVPVALPLSGSRVYRAVALDRFRNESAPVAREIVVTPNQPPVVTLARVEPLTGPAPSGSTLRLNLSATDDVQVTNLTIRASGFVSFTNEFPNGAVRSVAVPIPLTVPEGSSIHFVAVARDFRGVTSSEISVDVPLLSRPLPQLSLGVTEFELPELVVTNLTVNARHADGGLAQLKLEGSNFSALAWTNSNATNLIFTPAVLETNATFQVAVATAGTNEFTIRALATNDLPATLVVRVIGLGDLDRDTVPDRDDSDIDGDNLTNAQEVTLGTDPRKRDTDDDSLADDVELAIGTNPLNQDTDGDGASDNVDSNPLVPAVAPALAPIARMEFAEQSSSVVAVHAEDGDTNLVELRVTSPSIVVAWVSNGGNRLLFAPTNLINADLRVSAASPVVTTLTITATDFDGKSATNIVVVEVLADLDRDGVPDRDDADMDGDGLNNSQEIALGTDPRNRDTDDDGMPDGTDPRPLVKNLPPVVVADESLAVLSPADLPITIVASDPNADVLTVRIVKLPEMGRLFQTVDGTTRGALISSNETVITHPEFKLIFSPPFATNKTITFSYVANDGAVDSNVGTNRVAVSHTPGADSDGDTMLDSYEVANNLNPEINDAAVDSDSDGLTNLDEFNRGLRAGNPDTDADFLADGAEILAGTNPLNPDTDGDGIRDGLDPNPLRNDSDIDGDGIADQDDPDMDNDGLLNTAEVTLGSDQRRFDTDGDGWPDGLEVEVSTNPLDPLSKPIIAAYGSPVVRFVLPGAPTLNFELLGLTVSEPSVGLVLPKASQPTLDAAALTVSEPPVRLILPQAPTSTENPNSITVSEPPVGLVLPTAPSLNQALLGLTVSEPPALLVLPTSPDLAPGTLGLTVSEPIVLLRLDVPPVAGDGAILQSIEIVATPSGKLTKAADASWLVNLTWAGAGGETYRVESSSDLVHWSAEDAEITRVDASQFRGRCELRPDQARFYRVIQTP